MPGFIQHPLLSLLNFAHNLQRCDRVVPFSRGLSWCELYFFSEGVEEVMKNCSEVNVD